MYGFFCKVLFFGIPPGKQSGKNVLSRFRRAADSGSVMLHVSFTSCGSHKAARSSGIYGSLRVSTGEDSSGLCTVFIWFSTGEQGAEHVFVLRCHTQFSASRQFNVAFLRRRPFGLRLFADYEGLPQKKASWCCRIFSVTCHWLRACEYLLVLLAHPSRSSSMLRAKVAKTLPILWVSA